MSRDEVDRRQPLDVERSGSRAPSSARGSPRSRARGTAGGRAGSRPRSSSSSGAAAPAAAGGELAVLDQRLDDRQLEQRQVRRSSPRTGRGRARRARRRRPGPRDRSRRRPARASRSRAARRSGCPCGPAAPRRRSPRRSASVPFQPNGFTTRSASTPRTPDASISPFGVARSTPKSTPLAVSRASRAAPARAASRTRSARCCCRSRLISRASACTTPSPTSAGGFRSSPLAVRSPSPSRNALSVSAPAPFGPPTQWHEGQEMVSGPPKTPPCTRRNGPAGAFAAVAAAEPVGEAVLVLEEQLPEVGQLRRGRPARRPRASASSAACISRRKEPGAAASRRRSSWRRAASALRLARRFQAERRRSRERRAVGAPAWRPRSRVALVARGEREAQRQQRRRVSRRRGRHGTKSFGWRDSDVRKTRTLGASAARRAPGRRRAPRSPRRRGARSRRARSGRGRRAGTAPSRRGPRAAG